jgi:hypothetical protein
VAGGHYACAALIEFCIAEIKMIIFEIQTHEINEQGIFNALIMKI